MKVVIVSLSLIIISMIIELGLGKKYLTYLQTKKIVQPLLEIGPEHAQKSGTPTMGAISFIATIVLMSVGLLFVPAITVESKIEIVICLTTLLTYAYIGFRDDYLKVTKKDNESGLTPIQKLIAQGIISIIVIGFLIFTSAPTTINLHIIDYQIDINIVYYALIPLLFMAGSNATNITDGLDGLLTSTYLVSLIGLAVIAVDQQQFALLLVIMIVIGALLGFFKYNRNPAQVFMGDTGSLALGALLILLAILMKVELLLVFFAFIFIVETISVILQVGYFKYTKKKTGTGARLFKIAPLHHHYEKNNYSENKIVFLFTTVQVIATSIGLWLYFI